MISDIADLISKSVKDYLIGKGVNWENFINWLAKVRQVSGMSGPEFNRLIAIAGPDKQHEFWGRVIYWSRQGRLSGAASAELLLTAALCLIVAGLFANIGYSAGAAWVKEVDRIVDANGAVADQESLNSMVAILNRALASGKWRLREGWTARDAMLKILINMRTNRPPGFREVLEPIEADEGPVSVSSGRP